MGLESSGRQSGTLWYQDTGRLWTEVVTVSCMQLRVRVHAGRRMASCAGSGALPPANALTWQLSLQHEWIGSDTADDAKCRAPCSAKAQTLRSDGGHHFQPQRCLDHDKQPGG